MPTRHPPRAVHPEGSIAVIFTSRLTGKDADAVADQVWQAGVVEVATQLNAYLLALYNPKGESAGKDQPAKA